MKFSSGLALAGLATSAQALTYADTGCANNGVHIVSAGGEYTTQGNLSYLTSLVQGIYDAIPNSNHYQLPYTQDATPREDLDQMIPALTDHLNSYIASCPKTKIVTVGYSIGAAIVMDVLCGGIYDATNPSPFPRDFRSNIVANIVYGDPTFVGGMRSSAGTCSNGHGVAARAKPGKCYPYGRKTQSFCDNNDPQCCTPNAGDAAIHFTYPANYDQTAIHWVKAKYNYYRRHRNDN